MKRLGAILSLITVTGLAGVLVAPDALADLDPDADQRITDREARAYGERVLGRLQLRADGQPLQTILSKADVPPYRTIQAGYGTIRLHAQAPGAPHGTGAFRRGNWAL